MLRKEAIAYYINNGSSVFCIMLEGSSVFCTMLDATKAFDCINYIKLFEILLQHQLPPVYVRLLANMYTSNVTYVSWNGVFSSLFSIQNGVKQGRVNSSVYISMVYYSYNLLLKSIVICFCRSSN